MNISFGFVENIGIFQNDILFIIYICKYQTISILVLLKAYLYVFLFNEHSVECVLSNIVHAKFFIHQNRKT